MNFPTTTEAILERVHAVDPPAYARSRNYLRGAVTYLSPYLSRGVISTRQIMESLILRGFSFETSEVLLKELAWREFYQRVWQTRSVDSALRHEQLPTAGSGVCTSIVEASTGIEGIDTSIRSLMHTGYMHNHVRMYTAALQCTIAQRSWFDGAQWMYYHLLDGDWASNACSWQWVAGCFSSKKYYANQENINRYTGTEQRNTYLDVSYDSLTELPIPENLSQSTQLKLHTTLPASDPLPADFSGNVFVYTYYNLDPYWHAQEPGLRILLLEPAVFERYPVSERCVSFALALAKNIPGLIVRSESFHSLKSALPNAVIHYREHPLNNGFSGEEHARQWMCPEVSGYHPSFFAYWKKAERYLRASFRSQ